MNKRQRKKAMRKKQLKTAVDFVSILQRMQAMRKAMQEVKK